MSGRVRINDLSSFVSFFKFKLFIPANMLLQQQQLPPPLLMIIVLKVKNDHRLYIVCRRNERQPQLLKKIKITHSISTVL